MYDSPQSPACYLHTRFAWYSYPPGVFVTDPPSFLSSNQTVLLRHSPQRICFKSHTRFAWNSIPPGLFFATKQTVLLSRSPRRTCFKLHTRFAWNSVPPGLLPAFNQADCARALRAFILTYIPGLRGIVSRLVSSLQPTRQCYCATDLSALVWNYRPGLRGIVSRLVFLANSRPLLVIQLDSAV